MTYKIYYRGKIPESIISWIARDGKGSFGKEGVRGHACLLRVSLVSRSPDQDKERVIALDALLESLTKLGEVIEWQRS